MKRILLLVMALIGSSASAQQSELAEAVATGEDCIAANPEPNDCMSALFRGCATVFMGEVQGAGRGFCDGAVGRTAALILSRADRAYLQACISDEAEYELFEATRRAFGIFAESECALIRYQNRTSSGSGEHLRASFLADADLARAIELNARSRACPK